MGTRLYVGNIPYNTNDAELRALFSQNGRTVTDVKIVTARETGQSRGFAFVEMINGEEAQAVINELNGAFMGGRSIRINEARERTPGGGGGGPGYGGGPPRGPRPFGAGPGAGPGGPPPRGVPGGRPRPGGGPLPPAPPGQGPGTRRHPHPDPPAAENRRGHHDTDRQREKIRDDNDDY